MSRDHFRVLIFDLSAGQGKVETLDGRDRVAGGSGLAAVLFTRYGNAANPWDDAAQPLIFTIGPLTGYFPLMSKTVCAFKSPYHNQYAESHAGGRSALSLQLAGLDGLVITGRAKRPSCLVIGSQRCEIKQVPYLWGMDVQACGKMLRSMFPGSGHRSILRIGPAGENGSAMACINVDTYRHFGRLGAGAVMGGKKLKAMVLLGDGNFPLADCPEYAQLFQDVYQKLTATDMMRKYHDLGTPANVAGLNELKALPCRNLQRTSDPDIQGITGERFADAALLRSAACAGCPVGCIHIGFVREKFMAENQYLYRQVSYDHEPIFAAGSMLGVMDGFSVLGIIDVAEKAGIDIMSAGVALAWATEATEKGIISEKETIAALRFGDAAGYKQVMEHLGRGSNDFYRLLGQGTLKAAARYGGAEFACVLGQEMAGYATGEVFFISQALGFRSSHLDSAGYSYDQKHTDKDVVGAIEFLVNDERERALLTSMVSCLFARNVYTPEMLARCLNAVGYQGLAGSLDEVSHGIQKLRWRTRLATGFDPAAEEIPSRFLEITTWKGRLDAEYLGALKSAYARRIMEMGKDEQSGAKPL